MRRTSLGKAAGPAVAVLACLSMLLVPAQPARAIDPSCDSQVAPSPLIPNLPWAQRLYDPANRLWPFSVGAGVTVAVLDSGVDDTHPQLAGKVLPGISYVPETPPVGNIDCVPYGTAVASVIAAQPLSGIGFAGLAPAATILPVRVSDKSQTTPQDDLLDPLVLATGIDFAVASGANVIAVSAVSYFGDQALQDAVSRAVNAGVVVVAAVGDGHDDQEDGLRPSQDPPFPASYDSVIGVASLGENLTRSQASQIGPYVDLIAPGLDVTAAGFFGHGSFNGTSIATGFVAAAVALMLGQPGSDLAGLRGAQLVNELTARLFGSADGTVGGQQSLAYGKGLVDPYRAMTEEPGQAIPTPIEGRQAPPRDEAAEQLAAQRATANDTSVFGAVLLGGLALAVLAAALVLPRARGRRWRSGKEREQARGQVDKRPEFLPGEMLYRSPTDSTKSERVSQDQA